jgi:hypothetical protein
LNRRRFKVCWPCFVGSIKISFHHFKCYNLAIYVVSFFEENNRKSIHLHKRKIFNTNNGSHKLIIILGIKCFFFLSIIGPQHPALAQILFVFVFCIHLYITCTYIPFVFASSMPLTPKIPCDFLTKLCSFWRR